MANKKKKKSTKKKNINSKKNTKKRVTKKVTRKVSNSKKKTIKKKSNSKVSTIKKQESKKVEVKANKEKNAKVELVDKKENKKLNVNKTNTNQDNKKNINKKSEQKLGNDLSKNKETIDFIGIKKYILLFVILVFIVLVVLFVIHLEKEKHRSDINFDKISLSTYLKLVEENSNDFVYLSSDDCIGCETYEKNLKRIEEEYKISIKELKISGLSTKNIDDVRESNLFLTDSMEIPALLSVKDSNGISGMKEYNALKRFIEYTKNPGSLSFTKVSLSKYLDLLKSKDKTVIYIGDSTDTNLEKFSKTLESVIVKKNLKVYYLDTNEIITEENWNKFNNSSEIFSGIWTNPVIIIVKDGKIADYRMYSMSESDLTNFFSKNGI